MHFNEDLPLVLATNASSFGIGVLLSQKHLPTMTSNRLQSWTITLMAYKFEIKYRPTGKHGNADDLFRLPTTTDVEFDNEEECCNVLKISTPNNEKTIQ